MFSVVVPDSVHAFRAMAQAWRAFFQMPVIAVAGSVGKTTTKELLGAILGGKYPRILKTEASQNGFIGIPATLMKMRPEHQVAVIEVGIDECGAMAQHMEIVRPTHAILTAIGPEHLEKLKNIATVFEEESIALKWVTSHDGHAFLNLNDPYIKTLTHTLPTARTTSYALTSGSLSGFDCPLPGEHNAQNLLGAITVARSLGLTNAEIKKGLGTFRAADGRSQVVETAAGITVICDYYNSNPTSLNAALIVAAELKNKKKGRLWVCLGDMLELGDETSQFHRRVAPEIQRHHVDFALLYGPLMIQLEEELNSLKANAKVGHYREHTEIAQAIAQEIRPNDVLLIKGSRGMKMEKVWKDLQNKIK